MKASDLGVRKITESGEDSFYLRTDDGEYSVSGIAVRDIEVPGPNFFEIAWDIREKMSIEDANEFKRQIREHKEAVSDKRKSEIRELVSVFKALVTAKLTQYSSEDQILTKGIIKKLENK